MWLSKARIEGTDLITDCLIRIQQPNGSISKVTIHNNLVSSILRGGSYSFSGTVEGSGSFLPDITWSVDGQQSANTKILSNGTLYIAADETAETIRVTAASLQDPAQSDSITLPIVPMQIDLSTKGRWVGSYGSNGYILLCGSEDGSLNDVISDPCAAQVQMDANAKKWSWNTSHVSPDHMLLKPDGSSTDTLGVVYSDTDSFTFSLDFGETELPQKVSLYFAGDGFVNSTVGLKVLSEDGQNVLYDDCTLQIVDAEGNRNAFYVSFIADQNVIVELSKQGDATPCVSAIFFDPVETDVHEHTLEELPEKAPTCSENGNIACWHCTAPECGKYFKDPEGKQEIPESEVILPATGQHDYSQWQHDDTQHWKVCSGCNAIDEATRAAHEWVKDDANSTSTVIHYTCVCGAEKTEEIGGSGGGSSTTSSYTITVTQSTGGKISPSTTSVRRGSDKTFTITASEGYKISDVLVDGKSVGAVSTYTFENVRARHTITAKFEKVEEVTNVGGFIDVKSNDWFAEAVQYVVDEDLMNGTSSDAFSPNGATTRGMIVTILYRQAGIPAVESDGATWWSDVRVWAMANGISDGTNMDKEITREQLATMLYRYAELQGEDVSKTTALDSFQDGNQVSAYAAEALEWAAAEGIVTGKTGNVIDPQAGATRAETATMLMRFCEAF